jgi:hypothetical protein
MNAETKTLGLRLRGSRSLTARLSHRPNFLHREPIGLIGLQGPPRSRILKRTQTEKDGKRVLDDLHVALAGLAGVLLARAAD